LKNILPEKKIDSLVLTFTGGEPLLKFDFVKKITDEIGQVCLKLNVQINFSLITNGTLFTIKMLNYLNLKKFDIQITLDGIREMHNKIRFFSNKNGTFDVIIKNLNVIKNYSDLRTTIRINISNPNFELYKDLFIYLFNNCPKYRIYIDFVDVEKSSKYFMSDLEKMSFFNKYILLLLQNNRRDFYNYSEGGNCMIRDKLSFTIDSNLNFFRCYSFVGREFLKSNSYSILLKSFSKDNFTCSKLECDLYDFCRGGCIYKDFIINNSMKINCKYLFLKEMNSLIFIDEVYKDINVFDYRKVLDNVKYITIDI